jgi:hypothetical protein
MDDGAAFWQAMAMVALSVGVTKWLVGIKSNQSTSIVKRKENK